MTETRRNKVQSIEDFSAEVFRAVIEIRSEGIHQPDEIAEALNRTGLPDFAGHQWDAESVLAFLSSPQARDAERKILAED